MVQILFRIKILALMVIIAVGNISGRAFLRCSKEDWTRLNISLGGTYTLMDLQEEVSNHSSYKEEETKTNNTYGEYVMLQYNNYCE